MFKAIKVFRYIRPNMNSFGKFTFKSNYFRNRPFKTPHSTIKGDTLLHIRNVRQLETNRYEKNWGIPCCKRSTCTWRGHVSVDWRNCWLIKRVELRKMAITARFPVICTVRSIGQWCEDQCVKCFASKRNFLRSQLLSNRTKIQMHLESKLVLYRRNNYKKCYTLLFIAHEAHT